MALLRNLIHVVPIAELAVAFRKWISVSCALVQLGGLVRRDVIASFGSHKTGRRPVPRLSE